MNFAIMAKFIPVAFRLPPDPSAAQRIYKKGGPAHFHTTPYTFALSFSVLRLVPWLPLPPSPKLHQTRSPAVSPLSVSCTSALTSSVQRPFPVPLPSRAQLCRCRRCLRRRLTPLPLPPSPSPQRPYAHSPLSLLAISPALQSPTLPLPHDCTIAMVRTRGGYRCKPRVRFNTPERGDAGTSRVADAHSPDLSGETRLALAPTAILEEPQALEPPSRRYQTRVGPRAPSLVHQRQRRRVSPSKQARTSSPEESSRSGPEPSPSLVDQGSSPPVITGLEDQAPHVHLRSDYRERGSACLRLPWGAIL